CCAPGAPPRCTPFPYTTLFRSSAADPAAATATASACGPPGGWVVPVNTSPSGACRTQPTQGFGLVEPRTVAASSIACRIASVSRSEEHTSELQSRENLVCRLLL